MGAGHRAWAHNLMEGERGTKRRGGENEETGESEAKRRARKLEDSKVIYLEGLTTCYMIYMWYTYKSCEASHHPMRLII